MQNAQMAWSNNKKEWPAVFTEKSLSWNTTDVKFGTMQLQCVKWDLKTIADLMIPACFSYKAIVWLQNSWNASKIIL